jgi:hypothetical protein
MFIPRSSVGSGALSRRAHVSRDVKSASTRSGLSSRTLVHGPVSAAAAPVIPASLRRAWRQLSPVIVSPPNGSPIRSGGGAEAQPPESRRQRWKLAATLGRQSRSNQVSGRCLPKTGIFAVFAGDFCRNGLRVRHLGSSETSAELQKPANSGLFCSLRGGTSDLGTAWLGREDSDLRRGESRSAT